MSPAVRGCGLKHLLEVSHDNPLLVTRRARVWIETHRYFLLKKIVLVTRRARVWIETYNRRR